MIPSDALSKIAAEYGLSDSEIEALTSALQGKTTTEIAEELNISPDAARKRLGEVYKKFNIFGKGPGKLSRLQHLLMSHYSKEMVSDTRQKEVHGVEKKLQDMKKFPALEISSFQGNVSLVFEQLWNTGSYSDYQNVKAKEQIIRASEEYYSKYIDRHGQIKVMPGLMKEPLPLDSIYTAVKFLDEFSIRYFDTPDALEQAYRKKGQRSFQASGKHHDGISVAKNKQYLTVLGGPGVGKSTFLRKLGLEALKGPVGQLESEQIPILIELKTFRGSGIDLKAVIVKEFEICGFPDVEVFTNYTLDQGRLLILLDGLDEVPTHSLNPVIEHIEDFVTRYSRNKFVVSCRTAAYQSCFQQFTDVTIADFDDEQIEQFIQQWFSTDLDKETETAEHYWELLQKTESVAVKELAQTPLLLTFLCLIYDREQTLPSNRSTLYGDALNILLKEWSAQKRLERDPIYEGFHPALEKVLLSKIAYDSFREDRLFFSKSNITDRITTFLADTLDAPEYLDGEAVLKAIEVQQGILVERATDTYSFSHLTLQEYLTALYIVDSQLVSELVSQHLTNQRWREVFLLVAGLMKQLGHELLEAIDQQARNYVNEQPKLCNLLQWADRITKGSAIGYKPFEKRTISVTLAIALALTNSIKVNNAHVLTVVHARALTISHHTKIAHVSDIFRASDINIHITHEIARADVIDVDGTHDILIDGLNDSDIDNIIEIVNQLIALEIFNIQGLQNLSSQLFVFKRKIPHSNVSTEDWQGYIDELKSAWLDALELTTESISLSNREWQLFGDYLYANDLLLRCKHASIGLSRKVWKALEERLFIIH
ncbi:MAG: NACHT domain-containing protein [Leptolyngbya sp. SIO1D8]|nr:NACHT domain-containing protein [Leptolyngbya sp. SIO1D8]